MQQTPKSTDRRGSLLVRRSIVAANAPDEAETSSSSGAWQPQDTILEVEPSAASAPGKHRMIERACNYRDDCIATGNRGTCIMGECMADAKILLCKVCIIY